MNEHEPQMTAEDWTVTAMVLVIPAAGFIGWLIVVHPVLATVFVVAAAVATVAASMLSARISAAARRRGEG